MTLVNKLFELFKITILGYKTKKINTWIKFNSSNLKLFGVHFGFGTNYSSTDYYTYTQKNNFHKLPTPEIRMINENGYISFVSHLDSFVIVKILWFLLLFDPFEKFNLGISFIIVSIAFSNILTLIFQYVDTRFILFKVKSVEDQIRTAEHARMYLVLKSIQNIENKELYKKTEINKVVNLNIQKIIRLLDSIQKHNEFDEFNKLSILLEQKLKLLRSSETEGFENLEDIINQIKLKIEDDLSILNSDIKYLDRNDFE